MDELTRQFYEDYIQFENFIEFRMFDLTKLYKGRHPMISKYASNIQEVEKIIEEYDNENWIVYAGCNSRNIKKRVDGAVKYRRTIFFDIELDGDKPVITDVDYRNKLFDTARYIWKEFKDIGIDPNLLLESGRGLHLGIKMLPMLCSTYDDRFKLWLKEMVTKLMENRPHKDIKFDDAMQNASRIESCPPFAHNKYPEKPRRKVLKLFNHENNLYPFINRVKNREIKKLRDFPQFRTKYNERTFFSCPEWLIIANHNDLPEGEIHTKLLLQIKLLARDNNIPTDLVQMELMKLGYNEIVDTPPPEAQYNPWTTFNWCMKNAKYCLRKEIIPPYPFDTKDNTFFVRELEENFPYRDYEAYELYEFKDVLRFIREFNRDTAFRRGEKIHIFQDMMWRKIKKGLENYPELYEYMEFLKLREHISGQFTFLNYDEEGN